MRNRPALDSSDSNMKKRKKIRRSVAHKVKDVTINIMYSNIQGFTKKKESLSFIMDELNCDICLLAETMTRTVNVKGCRCIPPNKSFGQNVCIMYLETNF